MLTERARLPRWSAELLATTAAASLMVTPIIAHSFDRFQLMAVPANLLALAAPAAIMATGAPVAIWASAGWPAADIVGWAALAAARVLDAGGATGRATARGLARHNRGSTCHRRWLPTFASAQPFCYSGDRRCGSLVHPPGFAALPRRAVYGVALAAVIAPPLMAVAGMPRLFDDGATLATLDLSGRVPTVYVRKGDDRIVVAGSRLDRLLLDRALPRWDPQVDNLVMASSGGDLSHTALDIVGVRDVALVQAPPAHALGSNLVAPNRAGRAPVTADARHATGDLETELMPTDGGAWVLVRSPDAALAIRAADGVAARAASDAASGRAGAWAVDDTRGHLRVRVARSGRASRDRAASASA